MVKQMIEKLKDTFKNLDKKIIKILKNGLRFCFLILLLSIAILITYLFFIDNTLIYQIGLLVFQISLYFAIDFIVSALAIDSIQKQLT